MKIQFYEKDLLTSGQVVAVSGQAIVTTVSGNIVHISGQVVSAIVLNVLSGQLIANVSGEVVKISGETVIAKTSGQIASVISNSGDYVVVSGTVLTSISGNIIQISGEIVSAKISGDTVIAKVSGDTIVQASGAFVRAMTSGDWHIAQISGETISTSISGNIVQISGASTLVGQQDTLDQYKITDIDADASPNYYSFVDKDGNYYFLKETVSAGADTYRYWKGTGDYANDWTARAAKTYDYFNVVF